MAMNERGDRLIPIDSEVARLLQSRQQPGDHEAFLPDPDDPQGEPKMTVFAPVFRVGEGMVIRGSACTVMSIDNNRLTLRFPHVVHRVDMVIAEIIQLRGIQWEVTDVYHDRVLLKPQRRV